MPRVRVLSAADIKRALPMRDAIDAVRTAFIELSAGRADMPLRNVIHVPQVDGTALFMPSYMPAVGAFAVKTVNMFGHNRGKGLPFIHGLVNLFDAETGIPIAVMDGLTLTAIRTGAASGLATDLLSRRESTIAAVFGAGVQGRTQLEGIATVRALTEVRVYDQIPEAALAFADEMSKVIGLKVTVAKCPCEAVRDADIICAASPSATPVFEDCDIKPGVHINSVGSYKPHVQEVPEEMVVRSRLFVDHRESCLDETGDLIIPINKGLITAEHIAGEIGEVAAGTVPGRTTPDQVTFFKSVGVAVQDLACACVALHRAQELGLGVVVEV